MDKLRKIFTMDSLIVPLVAILLGLLVGAVVMLIGGYNPLVAYGALIKRVVGNPYDFGETIRQITPLIFTGLAVAFAFRSGMFNIGADGQVLIGMTTATAVSLSLSGLPSAILVPLAVIAGGSPEVYGPPSPGILRPSGALTRLLRRSCSTGRPCTYPIT